mmetsp:Transcript_13702/g.32432  ORF Transcript_13702/g.32432 Transcript_13702/m.32432 type:complete len:244 (+) Transcript_13702:526-1257(+)
MDEYSTTSVWMGGCEVVDVPSFSSGTDSTASWNRRITPRGAFAWAQAMPWESMVSDSSSSSSTSPRVTLTPGRSSTWPTDISSMPIFSPSSSVRDRAVSLATDAKLRLASCTRRRTRLQRLAQVSESAWPARDSATRLGSSVATMVTPGRTPITSTSPCGTECTADSPRWWAWRRASKVGASRVRMAGSRSTSRALATSATTLDHVTLSALPARTSLAACSGAKWRKRCLRVLASVRARAKCS